jgi:hypothetical protein
MIHALHWLKKCLQSVQPSSTLQCTVNRMQFNDGDHRLCAIAIHDVIIEFLDETQCSIISFKSAGTRYNASTDEHNVIIVHKVEMITENPTTEYNQISMKNITTMNHVYTTINDVKTQQKIIRKNPKLNCGIIWNVGEDLQVQSDTARITFEYPSMGWIAFLYSIIPPGSKQFGYSIA